MMNRKMLMGLGVGAALAYLASPESRRRRMRTGFTRAGQRARDAFASVRRGFPGRASTMNNETQAQWSSTAPGLSSR
jgi:hypothetical protein